MNSKLIITLIFTTLISFSYGQSLPASRFDFIIEPYLQQVTDSSFQVMWETSLPARGTLLLATADRHILMPKLEAANSENSSVTLHKLSAGKLKPGELYFYQVVSFGNVGDTLKGPVSQFVLPDYNQSEISFTVVGDNQGNKKCWERICNLMFEECPQFVIHCGDMVAYGHNKDDWTDELFKQANQLLRHVPMYPAIGNHEMNDEKFYQYFDHPSKDAFYTIKKGNLRIIFVDTNKDILEGSFRYHQLEQTLANCNEQWKIVVHHHPLFTSDIASYRSSLQAAADKGDPNTFQLKKLYETYGVDLVLSGHVHGYERTFPIFENHIDNTNGVTYIISGGGGGGFNRASPYKEWFTQETKKQNHFLNIRILNNKLTVEAIDTSRIAFDTWTIEKPSEKTKFKTPLVNISQKYFIDSTTVTIENANNSGIVNYRLNDENYQTSFTKNTILKLGNTTTISAFVSTPGIKSEAIVKTAIKLPLIKKQKEMAGGIKAEYYEGNFEILPDFSKLKPIRSFTLDSVSIAAITSRAADHFAVRFTGNITIPETDVYRFTMESFDGSRLFIDGQELINNDGVHYEITKEAFAALEKGSHNFEIRYFDFVRRETLNVKIGTQTGKMKNINMFSVN